MTVTITNLTKLRDELTENARDFHPSQCPDVVGHAAQMLTEYLQQPDLKTALLARQGFREISTALGNATTNPDGLVGAVDQIRAFVDSMADTVPAPAPVSIGAPTIYGPAPIMCRGCWIERTLARQQGVPEDELRPGNPAELITDGNGVCSDHLKLQAAPGAGGLFLPGQQPPQMPPGTPPTNGHPWHT